MLNKNATIRKMISPQLSFHSERAWTQSIARCKWSAVKSNWSSHGQYQVPPLKWHQRLFAHFFQKNSHFSFRRNAKKCDESHQILSWKMHFYFVGQDAFCFFGQRQILKFRVIWQNLVTLTCKIEQKNTKLFWRHGKNLNFLLWRVNGGNGRLMESGVRKRSKWSLDQPQQLFEKFHHLRNFGSILPSE